MTRHYSKVRRAIHVQYFYDYVSIECTVHMHILTVRMLKNMCGLLYGFAPP
jgi:hypothetical protein